MRSKSDRAAKENPLYEIRFVVDHKENRYTGRWTEPDGQESLPFNFELPLGPKETAELRWYLETYVQFPGAGDHVRAGQVEENLKEWGRNIFDAILGGVEGTQVYNNLVRAVEEGKHCLLTLGSIDPDFLSQPWEMMRDHRGPLTFHGVSIRRQLKGSRPTKRLEFGLPLRVLLIVSRPKDVGFIDPRNSIRPMFVALETLGPGRVELEFCDPPTIGELERLISKARRDELPYHVIHFDGHGTYLPKTGVGALCFENEDEKNELIPASQLGDLVSRLDVPFVILEACRGADLSDRPVFGSLAPALLESGVGSVLAFSHSVHIEASRILVERFYRELAAGRTIGQALEESRSAMHANSKRWLHLGPDPATIDLQDWFIPQLYQVGPDPVLIPSRPQSRSHLPDVTPVPPSKKPLHNFPPPPMYRFHGRAAELLELERALRRHPAVVLSGMGGMGKTALAREAAEWWLRTGRFEGAVFYSFEQKAGAERVIQLIGEALGGEDFSSGSDDKQRKTAVDLFRKRRILLVWDNFESTLPIFQREADRRSPEDGQDGAESILSFGPDERARLTELYRELTEGNPVGRLLVTCRPAETGLPGIKEMGLSGLRHPDALHLLAAVLDIKGVSTDRPGYERPEIDRLLEAIQYHPLSIELISPHLKDLTPEDILGDFGKYIDRFKNGSAFEKRNSSLLASLEFSKSRLSEEARKALPYLAWFKGGVFEGFFLEFSQLDPNVWSGIRGELTATALVSLEDSGLYLRFHPTLPYAARPDEVSDPEAAEERFIAAYLQVRGLAHDTLRGHQPAAGMALMEREEANFRSAVVSASSRGDRQSGAMIADTLLVYLQMSGRPRERDKLVEWMQGWISGELDGATCETIRQQAWTLFTQGGADEAIAMVQNLIDRLNTEGLSGKTTLDFQLAVSHMYLGRIYCHRGSAALAIEPLKMSIALCEKLGEAQRGNLAAALGDLANAYRNLGKLDAALKEAERVLEIERELGSLRGVAASLGQIAQILTEQQRYKEADERYTEALAAAREAGDRELQAGMLQHQGTLQDMIGNHDRAIDLYKEAIALFQEMRDAGSEMRTCDLIASAEQQRGQLDSAEAWYGRSRELALELNDRSQLAAIAQNVGILYQTRAEQTDDANLCNVFLHKAVESVKESLGIELEMNNQVGAAASYHGLGILYRTLGELDEAEACALKSLGIHEPLNYPDLWKDYSSLANIARDRGDEEAAAKWEAKRDAKIEELERLNQMGAGDDKGGTRKELLTVILALAQESYNARTTGSPLAPEAAEVLAQLAAAAEPLASVGRFLQTIAAGNPIPPVPPGLPAEIAGILNTLAGALK